MTGALRSHQEVRRHHTSSGRPVKPGNVPTARVAPILEKLVKDRWPYSEEDAESSGIPTGQVVLADKVGCDPTTIAKIIAQENAGADFDLVDKLFCALGSPDVWRGELLDVYEGIDLAWKKCACEGCSVLLRLDPDICAWEDCDREPRTRGLCNAHHMRALRAGIIDRFPRSTVRGDKDYCSKECRTAAWMQREGLSSRRRKRYMDTETHCRNGHRRTSANTKITGRGTRECRECERDASRRRYAQKRQAVIA